MLHEQPAPTPRLLGCLVAGRGIAVAPVEGLHGDRHQLIGPSVVGIGRIDAAPDQVEGRRRYRLLAVGERLPGIAGRPVEITRGYDAITGERAGEVHRWRVAVDAAEYEQGTLGRPAIGLRPCHAHQVGETVAGIALGSLVDGILDGDRDCRNGSASQRRNVHRLSNT